MSSETNYAPAWASKKESLRSPMQFALPTIYVAGYSVSATVASLKFPCSSAIRASLRFVLKTLFLIESLFAFSKDEF